MSALASHNLFGYLTDTTGKSYYVDNRGNVQLANFPTRLRNLPDGWADIQLKWGRNSTYLGIDRTATDTYKFVKGGAEILRYVMYNNLGLFTKMYFLLYAINPVTGIYEVFGRPLKVDFMQMSDEDTGVNVKMIEGGAASYIKANQDTVYEIPFDDDQVLLDGTVMNDVFTYTIAAQNDINVNPADNNDFSQTIEITFVTEEGENVGIEKGTEVPEQITNDTYYTTSSNYAFSSVNPLLINIAGSASVVIKIPTTFQAFFNPQTFQVYLKTATQSILLAERIIDVIDNPDYQTAAYSEIFTFGVNEQITLAADERIFFVVRTSTPSTDPQHYFTKFTFNESDLKFTFSSRNPATVANAISGLSLFQKLIDNVSGKRYQVSSTLMQQLAGWYFTGGDAIRQLAGAKIKLSLSSFFKFWFAWGAAMGVEDDTQTVWLEDQTYTYDNTTELINLGEISDFKVTPVTERIFNNIKAGFTDQTYDELAGRLEVNSEQEFTIADVGVQKELNLIVADIRADAYGLEYFRADLFKKDTTDSSSDNNVWVLDVVPSEPERNDITITDNGTMIFTASRVKGRLIAGAKFSLSGTQFNDAEYTVLGSTTDSGITTVQTNSTTTTAETPFNVLVLFHVKLLNRPAYNPMTGVPPTYFNAAFTPHRSMYAAQQYYAGGLKSLKNGVIQFANGKKNTAVVIGAVSENTNIEVNSLASYYLPYFFEFKTVLPVDVFKYLGKNGYISFTLNGILLHGFAEDVGVQPTYNKAQTWKLLCSSLTKAGDIEAARKQTKYLELLGMGMCNYKNPLHFVPAGLTYPLQYHFRQMDEEWHMYRIGRYSIQPKYYQKWQTNENITLQIVVRDATIDLGVYNCKGILVYQLTPTLKVDPYIPYPYLLYEVPINFSLFPVGLYTVQMSVGIGDTIKYYLSEPFLTDVDWKDTILIEAKNTINYNGMVFTTGYTTKVRIEGGLSKYLPNFKRDAYTDEPLDVTTTGGRHYDEYNLLLGGDGVGLPDWMLRKVSAILGELDTISVDGMAISVAPDAQFEENTDITGTPMGTYIIKVRPAKNLNGIILEGDGMLNSPLVINYDINTRWFSGLDSPNANQQDDIVQVTDVE